MVKEHVRNKESWKHICSSEKKKWASKAILNRKEINMEELLILELLVE